MHDDFLRPKASKVGVEDDETRGSRRKVDPESKRDAARISDTESAAAGCLVST